MSKQVQTIRMIEQYGNLKVGLIPLDFANAVIIAANVVQNTTEGGRPDGNTAPTLHRIHSAHDKALRLTWAELVRWRTGAVLPSGRPPSVVFCTTLAAMMTALAKSSGINPTFRFPYCSIMRIV